MNILRIIYEWPPPWDGLTPAPYEMTHSQTKLGHFVDVFCGRWPRAGDLEKLPNTRIHPFLREPINGTLLITVAPLVLLYYIKWRRKNKPDVIHAHGHFAAWIYLYRFLLKKIKKDAQELKIPLVVNFHNTVAGRWESAKEREVELKPLTRFLHWPLAKISDQLAVKVADAYIFVSENLKKEAIKYYNIDESKAFVVESAVNPNLFSPVGQEEKEKTKRDLGIDHLDKVILNNGAMVERKNIHLLVEAMEFLPIDYKLLLVGPWDIDYRRKVDDIITQKKLERKIIMVGYTPYPNIPIAFQAADIFVLASNWEGLPKVIMQSLSCGVMTLASGFDLEDSIDGLFFVDNLDSQSLAKQIQYLLENPSYVDINKVRNKYSWDNQAKKIDQIYEFVKSLK